MLEFLMYRLEKLVSREVYIDLIYKFSELKKQHKMQDWIFMVRDVIGIEEYNKIKECYIKDNLKNKSPPDIRCCAPVKERPVILFQKDIGATTSGVDDFMDSYNHILKGLL